MGNVLDKLMDVVGIAIIVAWGAITIGTIIYKILGKITEERYGKILHLSLITFFGLLFFFFAVHMMITF